MTARTYDRTNNESIRLEVFETATGWPVVGFTRHRAANAGFPVSRFSCRAELFQSLQSVSKISSQSHAVHGNIAEQEFACDT